MTARLLRFPTLVFERTRISCFIALIAWPVVVFGLAGCRNEPPARTADGRIPVRVSLLLISSQQVEYYDWAERTFEAANPDIDVIIEQFPGTSLKDFEIKLRLRFSSRQAPDLFHANENLVAEFARLGLLSEAPPAIERMVRENSLNERVREAPYFDGALYGIVSDMTPTVLYYNKTMFREAGLDPERPPQTWEELIEYADRLTVRRPNGTVERAGFSLRKTGYKPGTAEKWMSYLYSAGGRAFNEEGTEARFNSPAGREALRLYKQILDRDIDSVDHEGDQQGFGQGRVAMFVREVHVVRWLQEYYPDLEFGITHLPARDTSLSAGGTYMFVVSGDSPNQEAAWQFARFVMSDEGYREYVGIGGIVPVTQSVAGRPAFTEDPYMPVFLSQGIAPYRAFSRIARAQDILGAYIERFCYGHLELDETLRLAERDVNAVLVANKRR